MISVTLHCDDCDATAEATYVYSLDPYEYDAPLDGIQFDEPSKWWFSAQGCRQPKDLAVLCPEHNTKARREKAKGWT